MYEYRSSHKMWWSADTDLRPIDRSIPSFLQGYMHFDIVLRICVISGTNSSGSEWNSVFTCIVSTLDASGATRQNAIEPIIISDAVRLTTLDVARHDKSPPVNWCCLVLFMTYWHKVQMFGNGRFVASSVDRLWGRSHGAPKNVWKTPVALLSPSFQSARELALSWRLPLLSNHDLRSPRRCVSFNKG